MVETLTGIPVSRQKIIFGEMDEFAKQIEKTLRVTIATREEEIRVVGEDGPCDKAKRVLTTLLSLAERGSEIDIQKVNYSLALVKENEEGSMLGVDSELICHTITGRPIKPKTLGQKNYVDNIRDNMITFGVGPAGTGKTYLAMAMAVTAFKNDEVSHS